MYTFIIKAEGPDVDIMVTRALLALAAFAALVYRTDYYFILNIISAVVLLVTAFFIKELFVKFKINKFILLSLAAVVLFIATHSISFAVILLVYGYLVKFLFKESTIEVNEEGVIIKKSFGSPLHRWNEFSNIILKDNLLTLDFKNNKLLQLNIDETIVNIEENTFNTYCKSYLHSGK